MTPNEHSLPRGVDIWAPAAECAAVRAANLALKPRSIPHGQSAALPLSALTAWQALFKPR